MLKFRCKTSIWLKSINYWLFQTILPVYFCHFPAGCGINQLIHYAQGLCFALWTHFLLNLNLTVSGILISEVVRCYFGRMLQSWLESTPDDFPFEKNTAPITIHWGVYDTHNPSADIDKMISKLRNVRSQKIEVEFNHVDYMWGTHAKETVYSQVIDFILEQI